MTEPRHPLHPSSATQLVAIALSAQGEYGVVTDLARHHGIRRQHVYDLRERARVALEAEFTPAEHGAAPVSAARVWRAGEPGLLPVRHHAHRFGAHAGCGQGQALPPQRHLYALGRDLERHARHLARRARRGGPAQQGHRLHLSRRTRPQRLAAARRCHASAGADARERRRVRRGPRRCAAVQGPARRRRPR